MIKKNITTAFIVLCLFCAGRGVFAEYIALPSRIEVSGLYEYLSPKDVYGNWGSGTLGFSQKISEDLNLISDFSYFSRNEGSGILVAVGGYKDWSRDMFTFTSISAGTNVVITPKVRFDNDFNFKLGEKQAFILPLGFTYIWYYDLRNDVLLSTGLSVYLDSWIFTYRFFLNFSNPGTTISFSNLLSIGCGKEGEQWTYFDISYGELKSLPANIDSYMAISEKSLYLSFKHRSWIGSDYGVFTDLNYLNVIDLYQKYGISLGFFKEF